MRCVGRTDLCLELQAGAPQKQGALELQAHVFSCLMRLKSSCSSPHDLACYVVDEQMNELVLEAAQRRSSNIAPIRFASAFEWSHLVSRTRVRPQALLRLLALCSQPLGRHPFVVRASSSTTPPTHRSNRSAQRTKRPQAARVTHSRHRAGPQERSREASVRPRHQSPSSTLVHANIDRSVVSTLVGWWSSRTS